MAFIRVTPQFAGQDFGKDYLVILSATESLVSRSFNNPLLLMCWCYILFADNTYSFLCVGVIFCLLIIPIPSYVLVLYFVC